ncbi:MAG: hypothetical protein H0W61_14180 [Bacteroidetes bacterium]|nr:hypothetical protein [Bacteroidota bacterium]
MRFIFKYSFILLLLVLLTTCKKYEDGGWSNVAIKHLFGGNESNSNKSWKLKLYEVNGIDSTAYITTGNGVTNFQNDEVKFTLTNARAHDYSYNTKIYYAGLRFQEDKTSIGFDVIKYNCQNNLCERNIFNPEFNNYGFYWKIIRLKKSELILTGSANNTYKLIFTH